jgi:hypothetical protein
VQFQSLGVFPQVLVWYFFFGKVLEPTEDGQALVDRLLEKPRDV